MAWLDGGAADHLSRNPTPTHPHARTHTHDTTQLAAYLTPPSAERDQPTKANDLQQQQPSCRSRAGARPAHSATWGSASATWYVHEYR